MRIGIDARFYGVLGKGLGRYVSELIRELEEIDSTNEYVIFLRTENWDAYIPRNPRFTKVLAEIPWYGWREQFVFPHLLRHERLDIVHFPHFNVPLLYRRSYIVTVHDLILLSHPTARASRLGPVMYWIKNLMYRLVIWNALQTAKKIITVSEFSKKEIIAQFPFTAKKEIVVTYEAPTTLRSPSLTSPALHTSSSPTLLYVGSAYPHKNLDRLIAAFAIFKKSHPTHTLVLVGAKDYFYERLERETKANGSADGVLFFGKASHAQLGELYANAEFYIFPSLCEGFGLPPLEAMAQGLPVAAAHATALPEILGDAAIYFNPTETQDIVHAMSTLAQDANLRAYLIEKGLNQAKKFSWKTCADTTRKTYA